VSTNAVGDKPKNPTVHADIFDLNGQPLKRKKFIDPFWPLDHKNRRSIQEVLNTGRPCIIRIDQSIAIGMIEAFPILDTVVLVNERKSGAVGCFERAPCTCQAPCKAGLACPEASRQANQVPCPEERSKAFTKSLCFMGTLRADEQYLSGFRILIGSHGP